MKRTFAAVVTAVLASTSIWLAAGPADAKPSPPKPPPPQDSATIKVVPEWTYRGDGKLAVIAKCSYRQDLRVIWSRMLPRPVNLRGGGNLLIRVTNKTKPGKYSIAFWCVTQKGAVDAMDMTRVKVVERLPGWRQPPAPPLPRHFKANVTVSTGPAVVVKPKRESGKRH